MLVTIHPRPSLVDNAVTAMVGWSQHGEVHDEEWRAVSTVKSSLETLGIAKARPFFRIARAHGSRLAQQAMESLIA